MASTISAGTTSGTAIAITGDTSGALALLTNNGTTAVTIDTSQRVAFVAGTAALPAITTTGDTNTGIFFPAADTIAFTEGGAESMRINSSGTLLIGATSSPAGTQRLVLTANGSAGIEPMLFNELRSTAATENYVLFYRNGSQVGAITNTLSATAYVTSSDYRLKENIAPMVGGLATISALKPVTYTWKADGSDGQGFIAHELQAVVPDAVVGEKDATETYTDEDGNEQTRIKPQGIDTSFLVATLTAALQELNAKVDAQALEIQALKATPLPAENT